MAVQYIGRCIELNGQDITDMVDAARDITVQTFRKHIGTEAYQQLEADLGYDSRLRLANDHCVSFGKSKYRGKSCVYCRWSAIEYVFTLE